jgi:L-ribulose-5-phosphate 4-epimerase
MLEQLKDAVWLANIELVRQRLVTLTWGNVSGISDDRQHFVIKPSGVDYSKLVADDMVVVSVATGQVVEGRLKPSSDTPTHMLLYQEFSSIGGITHTHSTRATSFAQARRAIPCFGTTHADHFFGDVPVTRPLSDAEIQEDYELNTGRVIVERFADLDPAAVPGVLVASHAPFTWGPSAAKSVENAIALEAIADMALGTLALSPNQQPVAQYLLDKHFFRKHGATATYGQSASPAHCQ